MQQLSGLDAGFLAMETTSTFGHVALLSTFECGERPLSLENVLDLVSRRLHLLPPLRRRLVEVPLGISRPYWVEDPIVDLDFHVRELTLPAAGDARQLAEQVARIASRPLDRAKPLWELYLISGLAGDRVALLAKFHHAAVDGVGGRELMTILLDSAGEPAGTEPGYPPETDPRTEPARDPARGWHPDPVPSDARMLARGVADLMTAPLRAIRMQGQMIRRLPERSTAWVKASGPAVSDAMRAPARIARGDRHLRLGAGLIAPRTPFNRTITPHRGWAFTSVSLDEVKAITRTFGVTVNDAVMAFCAGALRSWLIAQDALPSLPLLAMVPISLRSGADAGFGNRVSAVVVPIATDEPDPLARLRSIHAAMQTAKERHTALGADMLQDLSEFAMPALAEQAYRALAAMRVADVVNPPFNVVISNVPGPRTPLFLCGAQMTGYYPVSAIADGLGLNITVQSYRDNLDFGLLACRELVPDLWRLTDSISAAADELSRAADDAGH